MENNENNAVVENEAVETPVEEAESSGGVDIAGLMVLGLEAVGAIVVAKKVIKTCIRTYIRVKSKLAEKKALKEAEKTKAASIEVMHEPAEEEEVED